MTEPSQIHASALVIDTHADTPQRFLDEGWDFTSDLAGGHINLETASRGNLAAGYPALRAQQAVYVAKQLSDYASGARYSGAKKPAQPSRNGAMMLTIAKRLTPEDIRSVASYVQGLR